MKHDQIERSIEVQASPARVWRALTDHREFGTWFRVQLEGPFEVGKTVRGKMTYPGFEGAPFEATITRLEPERVFAYTWPAYLEDQTVDVSKFPPTTVTFTLEPTATGTRLTVRETGFSQIPAPHAAEAFRNNSEGWTMQMQNIKEHVAAN